jgi:hypothetical protein
VTIREHLIRRIRSLSDDRLREVADFIDRLEARGLERPNLAEHGMGEYLTQLCAYEDMLAAGKIRWR